MKTATLALAVIFSAAITSCAFDWRSFFGEDSANEVPAVKPPEHAAPGKAANRAFPPNITPAEARQFIETNKPVVIDIRTPEEYAAGHLEATAVLMDYYAPDFKARLEKLDKTAAYLIYCRSGRRSGAALEIMRNDMAFTDAHDIAGGINAWIAAGYPVVK